MALSKGSQAPDFTLPSTAGTFTLSKDLTGKPCILYFYPKNFTPGCTLEACTFRDRLEEFRNSAIEVIGISTDDLESHRTFRKKYRLPFELCSDEEGKVAALYEAKVPFLNMTRRITYLLDKDHRIVEVYSNFFNGAAHVIKMADNLSAL